MVSRRQFLGSLSMPAAAIAGATLCPARASAVLANMASYTAGPQDAAHDEDFWFQVSQAYTVDRSIINLNNGGVSPSTRIAQNAIGVPRIDREISRHA